MDVRIELEGTTPLLMKNAEAVSKDHPINKEIAVLTSKRGNRQTEDDRLRIAELEWTAAIYLDDQDGKVVIPTGNVRKCFKNAAAIHRMGRDIERAMIPRDVKVPLAYDGPPNPRDLYALGNGNPLVGPFKDYRSVGIGAKRTMRMRPKFFPWAVTLDAVLLENVLDLDDFVRIGELAGTSEGLGDNRRNGFGRFTCKVTRGS